MRVDLSLGRRVPVLDAPTLDWIERRLDEAEAGEARPLLLTGGRHGVFAAGADLAELARLDGRAALDFSARGQALMDRIERYPALTVAAVSGRCIGGAFDLARRAVCPRRAAP